MICGGINTYSFVFLVAQPPKNAPSCRTNFPNLGPSEVSDRWWGQVLAPQTLGRSSRNTWDKILAIPFSAKDVRIIYDDLHRDREQYTGEEYLFSLDRSCQVNTCYTGNLKLGQPLLWPTLI